MALTEVIASASAGASGSIRKVGWSAWSGAGHGRVVDSCPAGYQEWVVSFLERVFALP